MPIPEAQPRNVALLAESLAVHHQADEDNRRCWVISLVSGGSVEQIRPVTFSVGVSSSTEDSLSRLDTDTAALARRLREERLDVRNGNSGTPTAGAKGDVAFAIGELIVTGIVEMHTVGAIRDLLLAFVKRTPSRVVTLKKDGDAVQLTIKDFGETDLPALTAQIADLLTHAPASSRDNLE